VASAVAAPVTAPSPFHLLAEGSAAGVRTVVVGRATLLFLTVARMGAVADPVVIDGDPVKRDDTLVDGFGFAQKGHEGWGLQWITGAWPGPLHAMVNDHGPDGGNDVYFDRRGARWVQTKKQWTGTGDPCAGMCAAKPVLDTARARAPAGAPCPNQVSHIMANVEADAGARLWLGQSCETPADADAGDTGHRGELAVEQRAPRAHPTTVERLAGTRGTYESAFLLRGPNGELSLVANRSDAVPLAMRRDASGWVSDTPPPGKTVAELYLSPQGTQWAAVDGLLFRRAAGGAWIGVPLLGKDTRLAGSQGDRTLVVRGDDDVLVSATLDDHPVYLWTKPVVEVLRAKSP